MEKETILDVLNSCKDYFENRADADHDENGYIPNTEMRHSAELTLVIQHIAGRPSQIEAQAKKDKEIERLKEKIKKLEADNKRDPWDDLNRNLGGF